MQKRDMTCIFKIVSYLAENLTDLAPIQAKDIHITGYTANEILFNSKLLTDTSWVDGQISWDTNGSYVSFSRVRWDGFSFLASGGGLISND